MAEIYLFSTLAVVVVVIHLHLYIPPSNHKGFVIKNLQNVQIDDI